MLHTTQGLILRVHKYQDTNLIIRALTVDRGIEDYIIKGYASATSRRKYSYFQPMSLVEIVAFGKADADLFKLQESRTISLFHSLQTEPIKLSLGLTIMEILYNCLEKHQGDPALYHFIAEILQELEQTKEKLINIFLYFLVQFTKLMGVAPYNRVTNWNFPVFFDLPNGEILNQAGGNTQIAALTLKFLQSDLKTCRNIPIQQEEKKQLIQILFQYYHFHIPRFQIPKTLAVFSEIFSS